ncbi:Glu/Leu/Phe/Val dehydrogenase dimerization domain-containing protein [Shinella sp. DD12]|uniref:Glu/Leu/Phe/Val dehydrogenase dimerization domain-containing protein n=1 Tax=Shinella sp. DD12 TaxID=1410620 RepID=UPI0009DD604E|nr:Glu/Leu/Phe/Val dehydrogenase dimerization domain-containing protein [Shinella sp. DD12]
MFNQITPSQGCNTSILGSIIRYLPLPDGLAKRIKACNSPYAVRFGRCPRGTVFSFTGWRSRHGEHVEPETGGIRYSPTSDQDVVKALVASIP